MIEKFEYEKHGAMIGEWLKAKGLPLPEFKFLPDCGIVVDDTACGFLIKTNSCVAWIDNIVGNPAKTPEERDAALKLMVKELERIAKVLEFECVFVLANLETQKERLTALNYGYFGQYDVFAKMLGE